MVQNSRHYIINKYPLVSCGLLFFLSLILVFIFINSLNHIRKGIINIYFGNAIALIQLDLSKNLRNMKNMQILVKYD